MRIAIPILTFSKAGGHRVLSELANSWAALGNQVEVILCYESEPYYPFNEQVHITKLNSRSVLDNVCNIVRYLSNHFGDYDAIIANQNRTSFYVFWASMLNRDFSRSYYYIQAYEADFYRFSLKAGLDNFFKIHAWFSYFLPLKRIVNSDLYYKYKNLRANCAVYPGLDLEKYYSKDIRYFNSGIKIGTIGRTEEWKGTANVCRAMEILQSEGVEFEFYLAFNDFDTISHHFVKPDGDANLAAFYRDMDIVVAACKGQHGAIHYPVIETMAVGSSIICTDYYPADDSNAYVVDEDSPEQIVSAVREIIEDRATAIEKRRQALVDVRQFDWPVVAEKFLGYLGTG